MYIYELLISSRWETFETRATVVDVKSKTFPPSSFAFFLQLPFSTKCRLETAQRPRTRTLLDGRSGEMEKSIPRENGRSARRPTSVSIAKGARHLRRPRGRDPCLCWPAVGVALSQALLSASSMKSAIARNCLELAQSNHPPFPVRIRAYINR